MSTWQQPQRNGLFGGGWINSPSAVGVQELRTFSALNGDSGVANIPANLTINGITVAPSCRYEGAAATVSSWTAAVGPSCPIASTGTLPTVGVPTPATGVDTGVRFANGQFYQATSANSAALDIGTDDFVITLIATSCSINGRIKKTNAAGSPAAGNPGWGLVWGNTIISCALSDGTTVVSCDPNITGNFTWNVIQFFCDRSENSVNGFRGYVNGVATGAVNASTVAATISAATAPFTLGETQLSTVAYFSLHRQANWFIGGAQNATDMLASARTTMALYMGLTASYSAGTPTPATMTRSSAAYLDRVVSTSPTVRQLFPVAADHIRFAHRENLAGGTFVKGAILEAAATNLALQSSGFSTASWTKTAGVAADAAVVSPTAGTDASTLVADATLASHLVSQAVTLTAAAHTFSVWLKAGNQPFAMMENATIANGRCWFNLSTGAVGTKQAGITEAICEKWGNGWFRCSIRFTGTVAAHTLGIYSCSADNVATATGDAATVSLSLFGAQVEAQDHASTYIATTTATATRAVDTLQYKANDGNFLAASPGLMQADVLTPAFANTGFWAVGLISSGAGAFTPDSVYLRGDTSNVMSVLYYNTNVNQFAFTGTTDITNGEKHQVRIVYDTNLGKLFVDNVSEGTPATVVSLFAAAPAFLTLGQFGGAQTINSVIGNVLIKKATS